MQLPYYIFTLDLSQLKRMMQILMALGAKYFPILCLNKKEKCNISVQLVSRLNPCHSKQCNSYNQAHLTPATCHCILLVHCSYTSRIYYHVDCNILLHTCYFIRNLLPFSYYGLPITCIFRHLSIMG